MVYVATHASVKLKTHHRAYTPAVTEPSRSELFTTKEIFKRVDSTSDCYIHGASAFYPSVFEISSLLITNNAYNYGSRKFFTCYRLTRWVNSRRRHVRHYRCKLRGQFFAVEESFIYHARRTRTIRRNIRAYVKRPSLAVNFQRAFESAYSNIKRGKGRWGGIFGYLKRATSCQHLIKISSRLHVRRLVLRYVAESTLYTLGNYR